MKVHRYIFGYRELRVDKEQLPVFLGILLNLGICAECCEDGVVRVSEADYKKLRAKRVRINYTAGEKRGLTSSFALALKHKGAIVGILFALIINIVLSFFVWDVRIEGNEKLSEGAVSEILASGGLEVGRLWKRVDKNTVEAAVLAESGDIAWLSVNRRGTVAYVRIIESEEHFKPSQSERRGNIVADRDCIIEEITVERGSAAVKVGDVVRRGDVLISGITEGEGGTVIEEARGEVKGRALKNISIFIPRNGENVLKKRGKICALSFKIFKFNLNIFKNYGNFSSGYDIIETEKEFVLFGKSKLPFSLCYSYELKSVESTVEYTDLELITIAKQRINGAVYSLFDTEDVVSIRTYGEFGADGYYCRSAVSYVGEVGEFKELDIN